MENEDFEKILYNSFLFPHLVAIPLVHVISVSFEGPAKW